MELSHLNIIKECLSLTSQVREIKIHSQIFINASVLFMKANMKN